MSVTYTPFPTEDRPSAAFIDYEDGTGELLTGRMPCAVTPEDRMSEGAELKAARRAAGLNLTEAAALLGVTVSALSSAEISFGSLDPHDQALLKGES